MGDVLTLDETQFGNGKLVFEYEDDAIVQQGYQPANILRVIYLRTNAVVLSGKFQRKFGEQVFPASDFPAALKVYRKRKTSNNPMRRIGGYYHISTWLTPEPASIPYFDDTEDGPGQGKKLQAFDKDGNKIDFAIHPTDYTKYISVYE